MAESCDRFMEVIMVLVGDENSETHQGLMEEIEEANVFVGKVQKVSTEEFVTLHLKGKKEKCR